MLYFGAGNRARIGRPGGATIVDVVRRAWSRLIRKQWLFLYPVALAVIDTLAFLAVYAAADGPWSWSEFFTANFERAVYVRDQFLTGLEFTSVLGVAAFAGIASCLFTALILAPLYHAMAGPGYPLAPRRWAEAANLFLFYLLSGLVLWVAPLSGPLETNWSVVIQGARLAILLLIVFADYVIVFEGVSVMAAIRRSIKLLRHGWIEVLIVFIVYDLIAAGLYYLYRHFYHGEGGISILLPVAQILLDAIVFLVFNLVLIFLYEDLRRRSPAG